MWQASRKPPVTVGITRYGILDGTQTAVAGMGVVISPVEAPIGIGADVNPRMATFAATSTQRSGRRRGGDDRGGRHRHGGQPGADEAADNRADGGLEPAQNLYLLPMYSRAEFGSPVEVLTPPILEIGRIAHRGLHKSLK